MKIVTGKCEWCLVTLVYSRHSREKAIPCPSCGNTLKKTTAAFRRYPKFDYVDYKQAVKDKQITDPRAYLLRKQKEAVRIYSVR